MTRLLAILALSVIIIQSLLLPAIVKAEIAECPFVITVNTLPATDMAPATATLHGKICFTFNPDIFDQRPPLGDADEETPIIFEYGTSPGTYTHSVNAIFESTENVEDAICATFKADVQGLAPCTTYYVRSKIHVGFIAGSNSYVAGMRGAGIGLDCGKLRSALLVPFIDCVRDYYGNEVSFHTLACPPPNGSSSTSATSTGPTNMSNIVVQSATITSSRVSPGENVDVTASVINKGGSNGTTRVTLFINGQEAGSKGLALASGQSTTMHFDVSRNDPGTYTVYVGGVPAGSFTVDLFSNNTMLIYGIMGLFIIGIIGVLYMVVKRRTA